MKKIITSLMVLIISLVLTSCGGSSSGGNTPSDKNTTKPKTTGTPSTGVTLPPKNTDPSKNTVALSSDASLDKSFQVNTLVTLDGSASKGTVSSYKWKLDNKPTNASISLSDENIAKPTFTPTVVGSYTFTLTITDAKGTTSTDSVIITITSTPIPLKSNAGDDKSFQVNSLVTLNGSASTGSISSYKWTIDNSSATILLSDVNIAKPTFTPTVAGTYTFSLLVTDAKGITSSDIVIITVTNAPIPVNANAGSDQSVRFGVTVSLNGSASTGDNITYAWTVDNSPSSVTLSSTTNAQPTFTANAIGTYTFTLTLTNSTGATSSDSVSIVVNSIPLKSDAGSDKNMSSVGSLVLDGNNSRGNSLTYAWSVTNQPQGAAGYLTNATTMRPTFHPNIGGEYTIQLTVSDSVTNTSDTSSIVITGIDRPVSTPTITRASNQVNAIVTGDTVNFNGSTSTGSNITYLWLLIGYPSLGTSPAPTITNSTTATPSIIVSKAGSYSMRLTVTDNVNQRHVSVVSFNVVSSYANAGSDVTIHIGDTLNLNGNLSRTGSTNRTIGWQTSSTPSTTSNSSVDALMSATSSYINSLTPTVVGSYSFNLFVDDNTYSARDTDSITATVLANPVANAGTSRTIARNTTIRLDGSGSTGTSLTYYWSSTTGVGMGGVTTVNPTLRIANVGNYRVQLTVRDHSSAPSKASTSYIFITVQ